MKINIKKKFVIIIILIVLMITLIIASVIFDRIKKKNHTPAIPATLIQVSPVTVKILPKIIHASGMLIAKKDAVITPKVSGYIQKINIHEGRFVQSGDLLFQLDETKEKNALIAAHANYNLSHSEFLRDQAWLKKGFITQDVYYNAKVTMEQNQATLDDAKTNLADRQILAPFSGMMSSIPVSLGQLVNPGVKLTQLIDTRHLRAEYQLPAHVLSNLKLNQPVIIEDLSGKNRLAGAVTYIAPNINPTTQMISVHATIDNHHQTFRPGEYVNITQTLSSAEKMILVPEQSIAISQSQYSVFIVKNHKATRVIIKIGERNHGYVVVQSGLNSKDKIIVSNVGQLHSGQTVKIVGE